MDCTEILKALSDRTRQRLVKVLLLQPRSVNELADALRTSQYNISKHLRVLRQADIVDVQPEGTRRKYFVVGSVQKRLAKQGHTLLDFGCCTFDADQLPE